MPVSFTPRAPWLSRTPGRGAFLAFVLVVGGLAVARRHASGDLQATTSSSVPRDGRLILEVRSDENRKEIANATSLDWRRCTPTIMGGYVSEVPLLEAAAVVRVPYRVFALGADRLDPEDGFIRAFRSTEIECAAADGRTEHAVLK